MEHAVFISRDGARSVARRVVAYNLFGAVCAMTDPVYKRGQLIGYHVTMKDTADGFSILTDDQNDTVYNTASTTPAGGTHATIH